MAIEIQRSLSGGELDPSLHPRTDLAKYQNGARRIRNAFVKKPGGISGRGGSEFIIEAYNPSEEVILVPFVLNAGSAYGLEFGDLYMRVLRNGEYITETAPVNILSVTNATEGVFTVSGTAPATGKQVIITGCASMPLLNGTFFVQNTGASTFKLKDAFGNFINTTAYGTYTANDAQFEVIFVLVSPYDADDLKDLQFSQSADEMTITHPSYAVRTLTKPTTDTSWVFTLETFDPQSSIPSIISVTQGGTTGSETIRYVMTRVSAVTGEESLPSAIASISNGNAQTSYTNFIDITFIDPVDDEYVIYREVNGVFSFLGIVGSGTIAYRDIGLTPDQTDTPPKDEDFYNSANNYPSANAYYQDRRLFGATNTNQEEVRGSRIGQYSNFTKHSPIQDDDSLKFNLFGRQINRIKYMIDIGAFVIFTKGAVWHCAGNTAGSLVPGEINPRRISASGAADSLPPIQIDTVAIYVQARGNQVRQIENLENGSFRGADISIFAAHLFRGKQIVDWCYQEIPDSIIWAVLDDGTMVGCTYIREHEILAWHRHDTDGFIERVMCIPEGDVDALYMVVSREINGVTTKYIERMTNPEVFDIADAAIMDAHSTYDGRNYGSTTLTMSGGTTWDYDETITLTASGVTFLSTDVGNKFIITGPNDDIIRFEVLGYTSSTVVTGRPHKMVPVDMRSVALITWAKAVDQIVGLRHLEGKDVSVFADSNVIANPNNDKYQVLTVTNGTLNLPAPYSVVHIGLPFLSDLETLDIDTVEGETLIDKQVLISQVFLKVQKTRALFVGSREPMSSPTDGLTETKSRDNEGYEDPSPLVDGNIDVMIDSSWESAGRVFIRNVDPLPFTISSIAPKGMIPIKKKGK